MYLTLIVLFSVAQKALTEHSTRQARQQLFSPSYSVLPADSVHLQHYFYNNLYDGRFFDGKLSWNGHPYGKAHMKVEGVARPRQNLFGLSNINSAINPFANFFNRLPSSFIRNPEYQSLSNVFQTCKDPAGLDGICVPSSSCVKYGGRPSSSCGLGTVCCVNAISKCGGQVTLNNTYWTSPPVISSGSTCGLTLTLDNNLIEQTKKICQIRLDFNSFAINQPNKETVCATDTFEVVGATNQIPVICGDNPKQHMYLNPPSSVTDIQLLFTFGQSTVTRSWNIKISLLPCLVNYLAPKDCLQYYTESSGTIRSFNWRDVPGTTTRQLANQNYKICFRSELVSKMAATKICYSQCTITNGGAAFGITASTGADKSQEKYAECNNDFLLIPGGFDPAVALTTTTNAWDRYCGRALNPLAEKPGVTVCSTVKGFSVTYRTNGDELTTATVDKDKEGNIGFCLDFQQKTA